MSGRGVPWHRWLLFWGLALGGAAFDLTAKSVIFDRVGPPGSRAIPLVGNVFELRTSHNTGALFGIGNDLPHSSLIFAALSILAATAICYWLFVRGGAHDMWLTAALGLIMAGALGNCYDRIQFGHVRDFAYFHVDSIGFRFPIFNFADNLLVAGALILIVLAFRHEELPAQEPAPATEQSAVLP